MPGRFPNIETHQHQSTMDLSEIWNPKFQFDDNIESRHSMINSIDKVSSLIETTRIFVN